MQSYHNPNRCQKRLSQTVLSNTSVHRLIQIWVGLPTQNSIWIRVPKVLLSKVNYREGALVLHKLEINQRASGAVHI